MQLRHHHGSRGGYVGNHYSASMKFTCFLDALACLVHIWQGKRKVAKASAKVIAVLVVVLC